MESSKLTKKRAGRKRQRSRSPALPKRNIVGCRISHKWKEGDESITQWNGTVLDQVPVNPSLYLVKYDGIDAVHALELYKDKRVLSLKVIAKRVVSSGVTDSSFVDAIVGKEVNHLFEGEHGSKEEWRGMVLSQAPILDNSFYITYERDPILYTYQLLDDFKEGDLQIMEGISDPPSLDIDLELVDGLIGKHVEYTKDDGSKRDGLIIYQIETKPRVYLIKYEDDVHIHVTHLEKEL